MRALALFLLTATPALADHACLAAPTQECVFQMAREQALAEPEVGAMATGIVVTAFMQEAAGRDDWSATLDLLWPSVSARQPDPQKARWELGFALFAVEVSGAFSDMPDLARAPQSVAALRKLADEIYDRRIDPEKAAERRLYQLGLDHDLAGIEAQITAADWRDRKDFAFSAARGLIVIGQIDAAFSLLRQVPDPDLATRIGEAALTRVLRTEGPDAAQTLARRFASRTDRAEALAHVAVNMAKAGRVADALEIADDPLLRGQRTMESWVRESLAEVHARGGERDRALAYLKGVRTVGDQTERTDSIRIIADTVALDFDAARVGLAKLKSTWREAAVADAVAALYFSGWPQVEAFLALLPPEHLPRALGALGKAQVATGDLPAALATQARLQALPEAEIALRDLRADLARLLVREGRVAEAVAIVDTAGYAWATAYVASRIK